MTSERGSETVEALAERWRRVGSALEAVRRDELRRLTDTEALDAAEDLLDLLRVLPPKQAGSGLVEQQRLFALVRT